MRILITGSTGFVGSYLIRELLDRGHYVGAIIRPESDAWRISEVRERVRFIVGSLDDISALRSAIAAFEPDAIAHLAWWGSGTPIAIVRFRRAISALLWNWPDWPASSASRCS